MTSDHSKHPSLAELPFDITFASVSDATAIATLGSAVWTAAFGWSVSREDCEAYINSFYTPQAWKNELADPTSSTYVARSRTSPSKVLGFIQVKRGTTEPCLKSIEGPMAEIHRIYVDAAIHGKGVGKALLAYAEKQAKSEGLESMWLGVWEHNETAKRLYERTGYLRVGEHDFIIGGEIQTDWILVKKFSHLAVLDS